jgi:NitT/TauT family transport system substrate-binding protein
VVTRFRIQKHGRLQELIAHEKGYFTDEGLDYEFGDFVSGDVLGPIVEQLRPVHADGTPAVPGTVEVTTGMFETYAAGRACDISSACHWAINEAASAHYGRMWGHAYSVTPGAIVVPPESPVMRPADLAGVDVAVGYHSGSHFSALQALESFLAPDDIRLRFIGMPWDRVEALLQRTVPAANIWGVPLYLLDQQGFRRVADATFMVGFLFDNTADPDDVDRYFRALKRAQADLDVEPERYKHHHLDEIPEHLRELADVRGFGMGERIVFLPYTREMYEQSQRWMRERRLFETEHATPAYESVVFAR